MKVELPAIVDLSELYLSDKEAKDLIVSIDKSRCSIDFTLDIIKSLAADLIKSGDSNKEEIIESIFN